MGWLGELWRGGADKKSDRPWKIAHENTDPEQKRNDLSEAEPPKSYNIEIAFKPENLDRYAEEIGSGENKLTKLSYIKVNSATPGLFKGLVEGANILMTRPEFLSMKLKGESESKGGVFLYVIKDAEKSQYYPDTITTKNAEAIAARVMATEKREPEYEEPGREEKIDKVRMEIHTPDYMDIDNNGNIITKKPVNESSNQEPKVPVSN